MPQVRFSESVAAGAVEDINLSPFDRAGGRGASIAVAATVPAASAADCTLTVMAGSDVLISEGPIQGEPVAGEGPNNFTPRVGGLAAPSDPLTVRIRNTSAGAIVVTGIVEITNA